MLFVEKRYIVQEKRAESKMENTTHSLREMNHVLKLRMRIMN